jgi:quinol monooxygenase YgiN
MSVLEIVRITAHPGRGDEIAARLERGLAVQGADPECLGVRLRRSVERPDEYLLELFWSSVEAHDAWRAAHMAEWRAEVGWEIVDEERKFGLGHYEYVSTVKGPDPQEPA